MITIDTNGRSSGGMPGHALPRPARRRRWRKILEIFSTIMTVLIAMVAALAIVVAIASRLSASGQYLAFGHPVMTVLSGSMAPTVNTGDLIIEGLVTPVQARHLHAGQIASFREAPGSLVIITHRIIKAVVKHGTVSYLTKGDANQGQDGVNRPSGAIVGVFQRTIPDGGYILNALHNPFILGLLLASVILFFAAGPLFRLARKLEKRSADEAQELRSGAEA